LNIFLHLQLSHTIPHHLHLSEKYTYPKTSVRQKLNKFLAFCQKSNYESMPKMQIFCLEPPTSDWRGGEITAKRGSQNVDRDALEKAAKTLAIYGCRGGICICRFYNRHKHAIDRLSAFKTPSPLPFSEQINRI